MRITKKQLEIYAEQVNSQPRKERRLLYFKMYTALNGGIYKLLQEAIRKEFKNPDAIRELSDRLVPINIFKKVIKKLGAVYLENPVRIPVEQIENDLELLEDYEHLTKFNAIQKQANRYLEAFQKNLKEIYVGSDGKVHISNLPPYGYEVFRVSNPNKAMADIVCKIVSDSEKAEDQVLYWYSDQSFWITNGEGAVLDDEMKRFKNPGGINPSGVLPFVYKCKSTDSVDPIMDDALYRISIALPIVLTDLFFASKYLCFSMLYTIGVEGEINRNPSSVVKLNRTEGDDKDPLIGQITPTVQISEVIGLINSTLNMFLDSVGLTGGKLDSNSDAKDVVSGVSKILDSAELIEGKKDQQDDMLDDENMTWENIKLQIPFWRRNNLVKGDFDREFSEEFYVAISFKEPVAMMSEEQQLAASDKRIKQRVSTWTKELKKFYPDYTDDQIDELKKEILDEMKLYPEIYNPMAAMAQPGVNINLGGKAKVKKPGTPEDPKDDEV